ncbi:hypothetical protein ACOMHN_012410 [Nucella lapillus]
MLPRRLTPPPSPAMATLQANPTFTYEEESLKENLGLLRRAFSSIKKRRKKKEGSPSPSRLQEHESLRAVRSQPATSASACNIYFRYVTACLLLVCVLVVWCLLIFFFLGGGIEIFLILD